MLAAWEQGDIRAVNGAVRKVVRKVSVKRLFNGGGRGTRPTRAGYGSSASGRTAPARER
ncbi:hypothetical protein GCM10010306_021870 [Streptomyces umbrinus]|nr:hypothetical protein GCM10010306_021870 [Streptomyces umbrinus]